MRVFNVLDGDGDVVKVFSAEEDAHNYIDSDDHAFGLHVDAHDVAMSHPPPGSRYFDVVMHREGWLTLCWDYAAPLSDDQASPEQYELRESWYIRDDLREQDPWCDSGHYLLHYRCFAHSKREAVDKTRQLRLQLIRDGKYPTRVLNVFKQPPPSTPPTNHSLYYKNDTGELVQKYRIYYEQYDFGCCQLVAQDLVASLEASNDAQARARALMIAGKSDMGYAGMDYRTLVIVDADGREIGDIRPHGNRLIVALPRKIKHIKPRPDDILFDETMVWFTGAPAFPWQVNIPATAIAGQP